MGGFCTLIHLPASMMMATVRTSTTVSTVTAIITFLLLVHLRLKSWDKTWEGHEEHPLFSQLSHFPYGSLQHLTQPQNTLEAPSRAQAQSRGHPSAIIGFQGFLKLPNLLHHLCAPLHHEMGTIPRPSACKHFDISYSASHNTFDHFSLPQHTEPCLETTSP